MSVKNCFPSALREILESELASGNAIVDEGSSFPAPPVGAWIMLARPLSKLPPPALRFCERNSSQYSSELTDEQGHFWILTAPRSQELEPDMDAIRARHEPAPAPAPVPAVSFRISVDYRGELIEYQEEHRTATVGFTCWNNDPVIAAHTLSPWWLVRERRSQLMTDEDAELVLGRIADKCRTKHGLSTLRIERGA